MPSYLKDYTKAQATRPINVRQEGFITGMNLSAPRRDLEATALAYCENFIPKRSRLDPRSGSELVGELPSGSFHSWAFHPKNNVYLAHIGTKLYYSTDLNTWTETAGVWSPSDNPSEIHIYGDDFLITQTDRILVCEVDNSYYVRKFNSPNPKYAPPITSSGGSGDFIYRYTYTFARYVGEELVAESGTYKNNDYTTYFTEVSLSNPIGDGGSVELGEVVIPTDGEDGASTQWTHINYYRTRDIGVNNEGLKDQYYLCYSKPFAEETTFVIGNMIIEGVPLFTVAGGDGSLSITDEDLLAGQLLNKLFYVPIPDGINASVASGLVSVQEGSKGKLNYTFTGIPERAGYYFEGTQFNEVNGKITALVNLDGYTAIICSDKTYLQTDRSFEQQSRTLGADIGMTVEALDKPQLINANVGVIDKGTISFDVPSQFIAVCNDGSVRSFASGSGWSQTDFARDKVEKEIRTMASGASSVFHPEGYYLLTYSKSQSTTACEKTLRLGLSEDVGTGWSFYGGSGWITPIKVQSYLKANRNGYFAIYAINNDGKIYQIETYNGPTGSGLTKKTKDRVGDVTEYEIPCIVEFPEAGPSSLAYSVRHLQTTVNIVPVDRDSSISAQNRITAKFYSDLNLLEFATYSKVSSLKNIVVAKDIVADYIRLKLESDMADASILGYEMILETIDQIKKDDSNDEMFQLQNSFNTGIVFSMGRLDNTSNLTKTRSSGDKFGVDVGTPTTLIGADGKSTSGLRMD